MRALKNERILSPQERLIAELRCQKAQLMERNAELRRRVSWMSLTWISGLAHRASRIVDNFLRRRFYITCPKGDRGITAGVSRCFAASEVEKNSVFWFDCERCCRFRECCNGPRVVRLR